ncbi:hypothetical protein [Sphingomicrobium marinum]|uniref:hypothetical protein n=1 Tax=Sphingomicrobium marinum TaxID=1227950 RepID=UPI00223ED53A|nr:hypothetical protein [Sphingomicrobium marinum]
MPFKHAYIWMISLIALSIFAFWRFYLGVFTEASVSYHIHGLSAFAWMLLLVAQSWSAHRKNWLPLHRKLGVASLFLFPIFLAGSFLIIHSMAWKTSGAANLPADGFVFYDLMGARLGIYDIIGSAAFAFFYAQAIKERRKVHVHARYLIATSLLLLGPALGRVMPIPFFAAGWDFGPAFETGLRITLAVSVLIAASLWKMAPIQGKPPMKVVVGVISVQWIAFELAPLFSGWRPTYESLGALSPTPLAITGLAVGAIISWWAWNAGKRKAASPVAPQMAPA